MDADDYYVKNAFNTIVSEIDDSTQLLMFGYNIEYGNGSSNGLLPNDKNKSFQNKKDFRKYAVSLISNEMINAPWNKVYLTSYLKNNQILFSPDLNIGEDLKFNLSVIKEIEYVKVINKPLINYNVKKGEGLVSRFRLNRFELRYSLLIEVKELLIYWGIFIREQSYD